jgi:hypothetical protein
MQYNSPFLKAHPHTKEQDTHLDGTPIDEARTNYSQASNVYFHIGGFYQHTPDADKSLAASYGCFGFVASPQIYKTVAEANAAIKDGTWNDKGTTNAQYLQFMQNIQTVRDKYDGTENDRVLFEIIKRVNVKETSIKKL